MPITMRSKSLYVKIGVFFIGLYVFFRALNMNTAYNSNNDILKASDDVYSGNRLSDVLLVRYGNVDASPPVRKKNVISPFSSSCGKHCERFGTVYGGRSLPFNMCGLQGKPSYSVLD